MKNLTILLLILLSFGACKKEDKGPQLPPQTHEGKNVIAWKMDGQVYISEGAGFFSGNRSAYSLYYDARLNIIGHSESKIDIELGCKYDGINNPLKMGDNYPFRGHIYDYSDPAGGTIPTGGNQYQTDDTHTGTVIVTYFDSTVIAGTFQMDVVNDAGIVRHVTEGRFDISSKK